MEMSDRARGKGQSQFRWDIGENFTERVIKHWDRLPREKVASVSLGVFKKPCRRALKDGVM